MHKILLVEDDEVIRQQVKKMLNSGVTKLFLLKISWKCYLFL